MIFIISSLFIFLPYLNRENCNDPGIGYTCKDLEDGVDKLQKLLEKKRDFNISFHTFSKNHYSQIIIRFYSIVLALATDSAPVIALQPIDNPYPKDSESNTQHIPRINPPSFAHVVKKIKSSTFFPICFNESSLTENVAFQSDMPPTIKPFLLNPSIYRLIKYIGPASYHILFHFALNISSSFPNSQSKQNINNIKDKHGFVVLSPMPLNSTCVEQYKSLTELKSKRKKKANTSNIIALDSSYTIQSLLETVKAEHFGYQIGDIGGLVATLLRGVPSYLYDPVSNACYKGRSLISGALNPLYSGIYRSSSDLSRDGAEFCHNTDITKFLLKQLL
ncbi:hypothetical protein M9Y10_046028 [Tritrichomonas musculus]|uniref:Uncharacterized protein n=1 Tax=Tritrichomonas musculus TaxID=1915356 RepID=A0ABR2JXN6_9EUKA